MMIERNATRVRAGCYDDMPLAQLLLRYWWPFWLFKDATQGDLRARAAAYRHNRSMRVYLPAYLLKWVFGSALAFALTAAFDALASSTASLFPAYVYMALAASGGILFAGSICVLLMTSYVYLYLGKHEA